MLVIDIMDYFTFFMLTWVNFCTFLFWFTTFMFLLNSKNLLNIILYSEIMWVVLYTYVSVVGTINDDLILTSTTFFLLALAGLEFCIGFIITILFRNFKKSFNLDTVGFFENFQKKKTSINRYIWSYNNI